jgi:hypothetical protein
MKTTITGNDAFFRQNGTPAWRRRRGVFRRRRTHDPVLVFNMSIFNTKDGWSRVFNPMKIHENGT